MRRFGFRVAVVTLVLGVASGIGATPVAAYDPSDLFDTEPIVVERPVRGAVPWPVESPAPAPSIVPAPRPSVAPTPRPTPMPEPVRTGPTPRYGIDVSYPQCNDELPDAFAFAIVGVNGGTVHRPNPCLAPTDDGDGQLAWAGRDAQLYANTGNPGPALSRHWPAGVDEPVACDTPGRRGTDTLDCAYLYGWYAAEDSYRTALDAFVALDWADPDADALPWPTTWWLDVETANSWRADRRLNVAALEGARDYLASMDVEEIGFYSTPRMWNRITGGTDAFTDHPAWHAGARNLEDAERRCEDEAAFTGGQLHMVQWVEEGIDRNIRCG